MNATRRDLHSIVDPTVVNVRPWGLSGLLVAETAMLKDASTAPSRKMAGWATTWANIGEDGSLAEAVDRDDQVMDAASDIDKIDWSRYLDGGLWNDQHIAPLPNGQMPRRAQGKDPIYVGVPTGLEWCPPGHELAQAHRKAGWFTWGHLFDRRNPDSWRAHTTYVPTPTDLDRADYYFELANLMKAESDTSLAFSVHGLMATSPCGKRIVWATVNGLALCTVPSNPGATAELIRGLHTPDIVLGRAKVGTTEPRPCGRCSCPPGLCGQVLRKSQVNDGTDVESGRESTGAENGPDTTVTKRDRFIANRDKIISSIMRLHNVDESTANQWFDVFLATHNEDPDA